LTTDLKQAKRTLGLSGFAALTGMVAPIGLSFLLLHVAFGYSLLASFAVGAALASTSLGTSLSALTSAKLDSTRVGALLLSTALIDDVIALVLLQLVVALAAVENGGTQANIGLLASRPIFASVGNLGIAYVAARWILRPVVGAIRSRVPTHLSSVVSFALLALTPFASVAGAMYAGSSALLGAFTGGIVLAYLDTHTPIPHYRRTWEAHCAQATDYVFAPIFFASIGFAIPLKRMFGGETVWRGVTYALLMLIGKLVVGICVPIAHAFRSYLTARARRATASEQVAGGTSPGDRRGSEAAASQASTVSAEGCPANPTTEDATIRGESDVGAPASSRAIEPPTPPRTPPPAVTRPPEDEKAPQTPTQQPSLWLPTLLLGSAMVARGEIGLVILNAALAAGAIPNELFLVGLWAVVLNTLAGPIAVGLMAKRARTGGMPEAWA
jgi:Kef-type K+ transport system membrane component KefB